MHFVSHDPPQILHPATIRDAMVHHEAGHLLLLHYYGWQIGGFTCRRVGVDWMGSIRNRRIPTSPLVDTARNLKNEARKLLAGELAARIRMGLPTDQIVLPLSSPPAETLTAQTSLDELYPPNDQRHDAIRVLGSYDRNRGHLAESPLARIKRFLTGRPRVTWWTWIWDRHAETKVLLEDYWPIVEFLGAKLMTVAAVHTDADTGHLVGRVDGQQLLQWCAEAGAPVRHPASRSISY